MGQSGGLNLKDVVCHLLRGDASLRGVNALHSVPVKASTKSRRKEFAIANNNFNGRSASSERKILPRSSVSEVLVDTIMEFRRVQRLSPSWKKEGHQTQPGQESK